MKPEVNKQPLTLKSQQGQRQQQHPGSVQAPNTPTHTLRPAAGSAETTGLCSQEEQDGAAGTLGVVCPPLPLLKRGASKGGGRRT